MLVKQLEILKSERGMGFTLAVAQDYALGEA